MTNATPTWLVEGALIKHSTFGTGVVRSLGDYRGTPGIWIDFDYGERKALSVEHGLPHLSQLGRFRRRTPQQEGMRCDACGAGPVVLNVDGQKFCDNHTTSYQA